MRRVFHLSRGSSVAVSAARRGVAFTTPMNSAYPGHYNPQQKLIAGQDISLRMTEFYDGYTDDFGVFKEGPPSTMRMEYIRGAEHLTVHNVLARNLWSPFECGTQYRVYSPFWHDYLTLSSRDQSGRRRGQMPGDRTMMGFGHYQKKELPQLHDKVTVNPNPLPNVPKWLAVVTNMNFKPEGLVGFFLYANGAYAAELLTHKQLPRLTYNRPYQGYMPTLGQSVELSEVTYGKEVHSLQLYPGRAQTMVSAQGSAAIILRGAEPNVVPVLLPSREVRLFDTVSRATFGRRAGLMHRQTRVQGRDLILAHRNHRPRQRHIGRSLTEFPKAGGNGKKRTHAFRLDWRLIQSRGAKSKFFLSGYIVRGRHYTKHRTVTELKSKTYTMANRPAFYR